MPQQKSSPAKSGSKTAVKTVGPLVAKIISRQRMKQSEVSRRVGMTPAQISNFLSGQKDIRSASLISLLQVLGIDLNKILASEAGASSSAAENLAAQLRLLPPVERHTLGEFVSVYRDRLAEEKNRRRGEQ